MHVWVEIFVNLISMFPVVQAALSTLLPEAEQGFVFSIAALAIFG